MYKLENLLKRIPRELFPLMLLTQTDVNKGKYSSWLINQLLHIFVLQVQYFSHHWPKPYEKYKYLRSQACKFKNFS